MAGIKLEDNKPLRELRSAIKWLEVAQEELSYAEETVKRAKDAYLKHGKIV